MQQDQDFKIVYDKVEAYTLALLISPEEYSYSVDPQNNNKLTLEGKTFAVTVTDDYDNKSISNVVYGKTDYLWVPRFSSSLINGISTFKFFGRYGSNEPPLVISEQKLGSFDDFIQSVHDNKAKLLEKGMESQILKLYFPFLLNDK